MTKIYRKRGLAVAICLLALFGLSPWGVVNSQSGAPDDKPVEQVKKNIQALKGLPDSQLRPLMNYFNAALGVRCNFCHTVKDGKIDFVSDEHEHKGIARQMIKMVQDTNKNSFAGKVEISCYTCHQGRPIPAAAPSFPLPEPIGPRPGGAPGAPPADTRPPAPAAPPNAEQIWSKYVQAVGGDAAAKITSRVMKATVQRGSGQAANAEIKFAAPGKLMVTVMPPQGAEAVVATDGLTGYQSTPAGPRPFTRGEIADLRALTDSLGTIKLSQPWPKMTAGRRTKINDRDAIPLRFAQDKTRVTLFFDAETGLLLRRIDMRETMVGTMPVQFDFADYAEVDGVKLPMTIRMFTVDGGQNAEVWKFTEVKHNVSLDGVKFTQ
ncbi:MAG: c-type cytochrome [Blastocatellia bacterium]